MSGVSFSMLLPKFQRPFNSKTQAYTFDRNRLFLETVLGTLLSESYLFYCILRDCQVTA